MKFALEWDLEKEAIELKEVSDYDEAAFNTAEDALHVALNGVENGIDYYETAISQSHKPNAEDLASWKEKVVHYKEIRKKILAMRAGLNK
jgi:hypothetical protein